MSPKTFKIRSYSYIPCLHTKIVFFATDFTLLIFFEPPNKVSFNGQRVRFQRPPFGFYALFINSLKINKLKFQRDFNGQFALNPRKSKKNGPVENGPPLYGYYIN